MKKVLLFALLLVFTQSSLFAQIYHSDDKEGLRQLLRQPSAEMGKLNLEQLGLSISDTLNWNTSEEWVGKIAHINVHWTDSSAPKRVGFISVSGRNLSGSFDASRFQKLGYLYCNDNKFNSLDLSNNTNLVSAYCFNNQFVKLVLSKNMQLKELYCSNNQLTSLDVSDNPKLTDLVCTNNRLTNLNTSNSGLRFLNCANNQLTNLNVSTNKQLYSLHCLDNKLKNITLPNDTALWTLICDHNQLTQLDVSGNANLLLLSCENNSLTNLDVSKNTDLRRLYCSNNLLKSLDLSKNIELYHLECDSNQIANLNVSKNTKLEFLSCPNNRLASLYLPTTGELRYLRCYGNLLTSVDLLNNFRLKEVDFTNNRLSKLITPKDAKLELLACAENCLRFSSLPLMSVYTDYFYQPQAVIDDTVAFDKPIDLSSEYSIDGEISTYAWYDEQGKTITLTGSANGVFTTGDSYKGKSLTCKIVNLRHPKLTLEYRVKVSEKTTSSINPETTEATIFDVEIYNVSGVLIKQATNVTEVPVQDLKAGTYIVVKTTDKGKSAEKIIKR